MKYKKITNSAIRAVNSEMVPYEIPLPFTTARLFEFFRKLDFQWLGEDYTKFRVRRTRLGSSERLWLKIIFEGFNFERKLQKGDCSTEKWVEFETNLRPRNLESSTYPLKYQVRRSNGMTRNLDIPHPCSMLKVAFFLYKFADTIIYFTTRSRFSLRYPYRVARLRMDPKVCVESKDSAAKFELKQRDLQAEHYSSFFNYREYKNINDFYSSDQFRACERKYVNLIKVDISKCFDSIYTHSISWATNGLDASKRRKVGGTFGDEFDHLIQYLNYAETSGIVIGPEFARIFAEIILQEIDVRVERDLMHEKLVFGKDYEIKRYIDDYFIFVSNEESGVLIESILSKHLSLFKLQLNELKKEKFSTPLKSPKSVAKLHINEVLERRTEYQIDSDSLMPKMYFPARKAGLDIQAILLQMGLEHSDIANFCLKKIKRMVEKTVHQYQTDLDGLVDPASAQDQKCSVHKKLASYLIANIELAISIYASAPSVSHSVKLTELIVSALDLVEECGFGYLDREQFVHKISQELRAQLNSINDELDFGIHTLRLVDCLIYLNPDIEEDDLRTILDRRKLDISDLDAFGVLTFLRRFCGVPVESKMKRELLERANVLVKQGEGRKAGQTGRVILRTSLPVLEGLTVQEVAKATGLECTEVELLRKCKHAPSMFAWNANKDYLLRLRLQAKRMVY